MSAAGAESGHPTGPRLPDVVGHFQQVGRDNRISLPTPSITLPGNPLQTYPTPFPTSLPILDQEATWQQAESFLRQTVDQESDLAHLQLAAQLDEDRPAENEGYLYVPVALLVRDDNKPIDPLGTLVPALTGGTTEDNSAAREPVNSVPLVKIERADRKIEEEKARIIAGKIKDATRAFSEVTAEAQTRLPVEEWSRILLPVADLNVTQAVAVFLHDKIMEDPSSELSQYIVAGFTHTGESTSEKLSEKYRERSASLDDITQLGENIFHNNPDERELATRILKAARIVSEEEDVLAKAHAALSKTSAVVASLDLDPKLLGEQTTPPDILEQLAFIEPKSRRERELEIIKQAIETRFSAGDYAAAGSNALKILDQIKDGSSQEARADVEIDERNDQIAEYVSTFFSDLLTDRKSDSAYKLAEEIAAEREVLVLEMKLATQEELGDLTVMGGNTRELVNAADRNMVNLLLGQRALEFLPEDTKSGFIAGIHKLGKELPGSEEEASENEVYDLLTGAYNNYYWEKDIIVLLNTLELQQNQDAQPSSQSAPITPRKGQLARLSGPVNDALAGLDDTNPSDESELQWRKTESIWKANLVAGHPGALNITIARTNNILEKTWDPKSGSYMDDPVTVDLNVSKATSLIANAVGESLSELLKNQTTLDEATGILRELNSFDNDKSTDADTKFGNIDDIGFGVAYDYSVDADLEIGDVEMVRRLLQNPEFAERLKPLSDRIGEIVQEYKGLQYPGDSTIDSALAIAVKDIDYDPASILELRRREQQFLREPQELKPVGQDAPTATPEAEVSPSSGYSFAVKVIEHRSEEDETVVISELYDELKAAELEALDLHPHDEDVLRDIIIHNKVTLLRETLEAIAEVASTIEVTDPEFKFFRHEPEVHVSYEGATGRYQKAVNKTLLALEVGEAILLHGPASEKADLVEKLGEPQKLKEAKARIFYARQDVDLANSIYKLLHEFEPDHKEPAASERRT